MNIPDRELVAVWKDTDIPLHRGQRLLALRTQTSNRTIYLYDHDGERPGWVSGDVIDATGWVPDPDIAYIAIVMSTDLAPPHARFKVVLTSTAQRSGLATSLRNLAGWPNSLGDEPYDLKDSYPDLYKVLTTTQPGTPAQLKESIMTNTAKTISSRVSRTGSDNADAFKRASYLEAGTIVNKQLVKLAAARLPLMMRGYADTPIGQLVIANMLKVAVHELRPDNALLQRLTDASLEAAHLEVIRTLDINGFIDNLLSDETLKRAMSKLDDGSQA